VIEYRISIYARNKRLRWIQAYEDGRAALHAAFAVLEEYIGEDVPFGLSILRHRPQQKEVVCAATA